MNAQPAIPQGCEASRTQMPKGRGLPVAKRKLNRENRSLPFLASHGDGSSMVSDNLMSDVETQAKTRCLVAFGGGNAIKTLKDVIQMLMR